MHMERVKKDEGGRGVVAGEKGGVGNYMKYGKRQNTKTRLNIQKANQ